MIALKNLVPLKALRLLDGLPNAVAAPAFLISVIQIATALAPSGAVRRVWRLFELSPARVIRALEAGDLAGVVRPYLGYMFFHVNFAHYALNLIATVIAGVFVYREMDAHAQPGKSDAPAAFLAFFILSGLAAGFTFSAANQNAYTPMIGASGAAAGLFGAALWIFLMRSEPEKPQQPAWRPAALLGVATLDIIMASYLLDTSPLSHFLFNSASAWQAHAGGCIFGVLFYPLFERMAASSR